MKFDISNVYSAATADQLEPGDQVICADNMSDLKEFVAEASGKVKDLGVIEAIGNESVNDRFKLVNDTNYALAYLVKKVEYRPFKDINELIKVWDAKYREKYGLERIDKGLDMPQIWVMDKDRGDSIGSMVTEFFDGCVCIGTIGSCTLENLMKCYTFLDGTPCGVKK